MRASLAVPLLLLVALLSLLAPALVNGSMFMFPDTIGYYHAGEASLKPIERLLSAPAVKGAAVESPLALEASDDISTSRSVYYGLPMVLLTRLGGEWAFIVAQTALTLGAMFLALRRLGLPPGAQALVYLTTLPAGLFMFTSVGLPDVFAGLAVLALAMLLPIGMPLSRFDRLFWLGLLLLACLVHKGILATVAATLILAFLWQALTTRSWRHLAGPVLAVVVAFAGHSAVNIVVEKVTGVPPLQTPFLLARSIGDGTAERHLRSVCPEAGYALCAHLDRFPMTENTFLWSHDPDDGIMQVLPLQERRKIVAEGNKLVLAAVIEQPLQQLRISLTNAVTQFGTVGVTRYALGPNAGAHPRPALVGILDRYDASLAGQGLWPFKTVSQVMTLAYFGSLVLLVAALWPLRTRPPGSPELEALVWILIGLVTNAAVCGVLGTVADRYQGRLAWLVPLAAVTAIWLARQPKALARPR